MNSAEMRKRASREADIKETQIRFENACRAMSAIGIKKEKVKQVLKTLLKLYDKNWALIEEGNYRALADAILDRDEEEVEEQPRKNVDNEAQDHLEKEAQKSEELERPWKMLKREYLDGQTSSLNTSITSTPPTPPIRFKEEPDELSETHCIKLSGTRGMEECLRKNAEITMTTPQVVMSQLLGESKGKQPSSSNSLVHENGDPSNPSSINKSQQIVRLTNSPRLPSHRMRLRERDTRSASLQTPTKVKRPVPKSSSHARQSEEPNVEPDTVLLPKNITGSHAFFKTKDEPITGDMPCSKVLVNMFHIDTSHGGNSMTSSMLRGDCTPEPTTLQSVREKNTADVTFLYEAINNGELKTSRGECSSTLEIASSPSGEVKLSLSYKLAPGRPDFHMPSPEAVLKSVEDKCIRSPKGPNTSMMALMKEMCECFLELGTYSNRQSVIVDATKSSAAGVRGAKASGISSLNGLADSRSGDKVPHPKAKVLSPPLNGRNGGPQLNKLDAEDKIVINRENQVNCAEEMDGLSLVAVQQRHLTCQITRSIHDVVDIAKGQEKFAITVVNEVNDEHPPSFCYIRQSAIYQNAYANFSLARIGDHSCCSTCSGDCLSLSIPCACSHESGGEFAYTADGLVKEELLNECISMNRDPKKHCQFFCKECPLERSKCEDIIEPCKGHLLRNFVKECWIKCGCNVQCGNRVVQRGISRKLQVFMTPEGKGWGLRTLEDLPKGAFVCEYVGEVLTNAELFERVLRSRAGEKHSYPVLLDADWCAEGVLKDEEALCLDATYYGNVARFINHKCYDSNLVEIPVEVETPDHHYYHLAFFTSRKVKAMEELTWDYGIDFDDHEHPIKAFRCQCGSKFCRNIKRSRSRAGRR
ncbi:probable inactive histone-lysine N-methyltransferase SUVR2 [Salvia miltiorrhiza]|uniref:probable inactive histone-lysine N-methyltransferase SUVR2 n=1 Tax=Salvia miltiorrhiza TaxID=226208 RepID=UPI0025ABD4A7|nr:probable inactive histone-lysine N-methyltransferase SUVR2 [Salvia miltiorrhiza]XP_057798193.1 probable inactive histone-lysine N-methyltransferase SUVR2 [Salvia miltiorrhiza]XP_057798194.1 probable inactive histone-lysine N-methyltransferase SUVR2 [Salvia miltiorrhiza]XP_057798195.1 probable inactive histone-lysine N-methyltransferase SUVR2 [Salvia miltiorrhiza]XP_057798196.1 probable inactive histone-lysine N-methyltransferase SUVR2 [Salvia miltiorrhiza]